MIYENDNFIMLPFNRMIANQPQSTYRFWWADAEVTKFNSHGLFPQSEKELENFFDTIGRNNIVWAIMARRDPNGVDTGKLHHIGNTSLQSINFIHRSGEYAIVIGEKAYWGKGYASETAQFVLQHGFKRLGLNRIWTGTAAVNLGMQRVAERMGMTKEGCSREGMYLDGNHVDIYHYGILRSEWISKNQ